MTPALFELTRPLETQRLLLRPFRADDYEALFELHSRPEVAQFLTWEARNAEQVRKALELKLKAIALRDEGDFLAFVVTLKGDGSFVGEFSLGWTSRQHRRGNIGYIIHPAHQGRGYATEAGRAVLELAFGLIGLRRVVAELDARNAASARVLERLGMRKEADFVENEFYKGEWTSTKLYAVLEREWRASTR